MVLILIFLDLSLETRWFRYPEQEQILSLPFDSPSGLNQASNTVRLREGIDYLAGLYAITDGVYLRHLTR